MELFHPEAANLGRLGEGLAEGVARLWPCTASTALRPVTSVPPIAASTREVLEALGMTSKVSSAAHHTIRSSSTEPSSSSRWVYCALPGAILPRSLVSARWSVGFGVRPRQPHGAKVAHVENGDIPTAGHVLGDGAVLVLEGHLPATERHHPRPIAAVPARPTGYSAAPVPRPARGAQSTRAHRAKAHRAKTSSGSAGEPLCRPGAALR